MINYPDTPIYIISARGTGKSSAYLDFIKRTWKEDMNFDTIDYWLHRFDQMGLFEVDFTEPEYSDLVRDLVTVGFDNPIQLFGAIDRAID